jgi:O-antigen/teichoic acid export membrane protein
VARVLRASIATAFGYLRFLLALVAGLVLVPFILHHIDPVVYGYWLASGDVLAYAAMTDFGLLGTLPWLIAEADGRGDRAAIRRLMSNGAMAAIALTVLYGAVVLIIWNLMPSIIKLDAAQRAMVKGPLTLIASIGALNMTLRLFTGTLAGLQDVRFQGIVSTLAWAADVALTIVLLKMGYGLYALAAAAAFPGMVSATASMFRVRMIAPDLLRGWPRPTVADIAKLFRESVGAWFSQWGWRLTTATDGIILASLGRPHGVAALAMTSRLGGMLMQMSWLPGDTGLVGLVNLYGEGKAARIRAAVLALLRVYIALAGAGVCVVLAVNPSFVSAWVGEPLYAGDQVNGLLSVSLMVTTIGHAVSVVAAVLGYRMRVGTVTFISGAVQAVLAFTLGARLGIFGVVLASVLAQAFVLLPLLARPFAHNTGVTFGDLLRDVAAPLLARSGPLAVAALFIGLWLPPPPLWIVVPLGAVIGLGYLWLTRGVYLDYPSIQSLLDRLPAWGMPPALRRRLVPRQNP